MGQLSSISTSDEVFPYMREWVDIYPMNAKEKFNDYYTGHNTDCLL